ncbi:MULTISPECIES: succinate dehydrogenase, hydrophobic membrane anchor protein [unclassified Novosphingobium]|uniref:succinate dehydrogenase, hydrophobic membrane anchor protein n=1 Tax=unclassified Novosphingobium TaxID=2644732 RepID=UPI0025F60AF7|nr:MULTISPECIES: succinate dehydrogenase, hydrophobic membrane anchor protein [unclassified Novosphingobium]HQV03012.1 succinate dehydrogenase, hydrophobic membrane anchor protein [Novosphingobium sp.]
MGNGTSIGRVRGHGSAHSGSHHWLLQRYTAIGNLFLGLWLVFSLVTLPDYTYPTVMKWATAPLSLTFLALFVISTFWHARLGLQVVVEDYVHEPANKFAAVAALNFAAFGGAAACLFYIARMAMLASGQETAAGIMQQLQQSMGGR